MVIIAACLAGILLYLVAFRTGNSSLQSAQSRRTLSKDSVLQAWEKSDWKTVLGSSESALASKPLDPFYLGMKGLASYCEAMELPEGQMRADFVETSIVSLRKALATRESAKPGKIPKAELEYVLGKAYYQKGGAMLDLSAKFMEAALRDGYAAQDAHEYLAMSYSALGDSSRALAEFYLAMGRNKSALLKIAAAKEQLIAGETVKAEQLLLEASTDPTDAVAREKARLLLSEYYFEHSRWDDSEAQAIADLQENPDSAEAHYRLGLVYQVRGDPVHARSEWRKAVSIDPMHAAARQKLAER